MKKKLGRISFELYHPVIENLLSFYFCLMGGQKPIDPASLDKQKMAALAEHPWIIDLVDEWTLDPDMHLAPKMHEAAKIINHIYGFNKDLEVYRGIYPDRYWQNKLGLVDEETGKIDTFAEGDLRTYKSNRPLSFTTDRSMAEYHGDVVVGMIVNPTKHPMLVITDELFALICAKRGTRAETQREVVILPPFEITFTILQKGQSLWEKIGNLGTNLKKKLGRLSLESFDQAPTGNVRPMAQPETPPQPLVPTAGYSETPFSGEENYAAEEHVESDVKEYWQKLLGYWKHYGDDEILESLNPGANSGEISALESEFHVRLPEAFIALLKLNNGQNEDNHGGWCFGHREFLGTQRIIERTREWQGLNQQAWGMYRTDYTDKAVKEISWSNKWLIFGWSEDHRPSFLVLDFDPTHEGKMGQVVSIDLREGRRVVVAPDFLTWFKRFVTHLTTPSHGAVATESHTKPPYPLRTALEAEVTVVDTDELDQLAIDANSLSSFLSESGAGMALESEKHPSDIAKSRMHLRFKKLKDGFVDTFRSAASMAAKYEKQLDELEAELLKGHTHGQIKVNMSHLWQHFSDEKGPITHNLLGKVREDVAFSTYILTVFSEQAYKELEGLSRVLHTGQGSDDEQAKRTALDVEKLKGPVEYMDQKWICAAGEQPYLSVTGLSAQQGRHPRPMAIMGASLDRLALLATPYHLREYGSFLHGLKKMFVSNSNKEAHLAVEDLAKLIVLGRQYINSAKLYLAIYNKVWPIFRRLDASLDLIWDDFGLTDYEVNVEGKAEDGSDDVTLQWQESETGNTKRRVAVFNQLMQVVHNFSDAVLQPGVNEMARALRAAKFHGYLVAAGIKVAEGHGQHAGNVAQELFGFGKKKKPEEDEASDNDRLLVPDVDPKHSGSIEVLLKTANAILHIVKLPPLDEPASPNHLKLLTDTAHEAKVSVHPSVLELYKVANGEDFESKYRLFTDGRRRRRFSEINIELLVKWQNSVIDAKGKIDFVPLSFFSGGYIGVRSNGQVVVCDSEFKLTPLASDLRTYLARCVHELSVWAKHVQSGQK